MLIFNDLFREGIGCIFLKMKFVWKQLKNMLHMNWHKVWDRHSCSQEDESINYPSLTLIDENTDCSLPGFYLLIVQCEISSS